MKRFFNRIRRLWVLPGQVDLAWARIVALEKKSSSIESLQKQIDDLRAVIAAGPGRPRIISARTASVFRRLTEDEEGMARTGPQGGSNATPAA